MLLDETTMSSFIREEPANYKLFYVQEDDQEEGEADARNEGYTGFFLVVWETAECNRVAVNNL